MSEPQLIIIGINSRAIGLAPYTVQSPHQSLTSNNGLLSRLLCSAPITVPRLFGRQQIRYLVSQYLTCSAHAQYINSIVCSSDRDQIILLMPAKPLTLKHHYFCLWMHYRRCQFLSRRVNGPLQPVGSTVLATLGM